jgi:hypothetical protein
MTLPVNLTIFKAQAPLAGRRPARALVGSESGCLSIQKMAAFSASCNVLHIAIFSRICAMCDVRNPEFPNSDAKKTSSPQCSPFFCRR